MVLAQAFGHAESNIDRCVTGKQRSEPRGGWPIRVTHCVNKATSEIPVALVRVDEYARQAGEAREANGDGEVGRLHSTFEAG